MTSYFSLIPELFLPLLQLLILHKYMKIFLGAGNNHVQEHIEWGIYYIFLLINSIGNFHFPPNLLLFGNFFLIFVISATTRKINLRHCCIFAFFMCTVWMLIEVLVMMLLQTIGFESTVLQNAGSFISKMFMLIFAVVIRHTIKDNHDSPIPLRYFLIILLVPASSIYIMHNIFLIANAHTEYILFSAIASFIFLIVNYVIFEIYDWIRHNAELREQNRLYIQQLELCSQQAKERELHNLELRRIRHDLKKHLSGLLGMLQAKQINEAKGYITQLLNDGIINCPEEVSHSGNIVVDSLINHSCAYAQKDQIDFDINVFIPTTLPFENGHIAIILGNLMENALDACREIPNGKRYIYLDISYAKEVLQLIIRNNYQIKRKKDRHGNYLTTKADRLHLDALYSRGSTRKFQGQLLVPGKVILLARLDLYVHLRIDIRAALVHYEGVSLKLTFLSAHLVEHQSAVLCTNHSLARLLLGTEHHSHLIVAIRHLYRIEERRIALCLWSSHDVISLSLLCGIDRLRLQHINIKSLGIGGYRRSQRQQTGK